MSSPRTIIEVPPHKTPELTHVLKHDTTVLALVASEDSIYAGTHFGEIIVWSLDTFEQNKTVQAHKRTIMCLFLSDDNSLLCSSASDPIVSIWDPKTMSRLYEIYSLVDSFGDIFSVAYSSLHNTVYYGCQNTLIQWVRLDDEQRRVSHDSPNHPSRRLHPFFDSRAVGGTITPRPNEERANRIPQANQVLETDRRCSRMFAHRGYVYSMILAKGATTFANPDEQVLISCDSGGNIKVWKLGGHGVGPDGYDLGLVEIMCLNGDRRQRCVYSLAIDGSFLYTGLWKGLVELWDLDTKQKLRVIKAHEREVMTLQMGWGYLWIPSNEGNVAKYSTVHYGEYQSNGSQHISQKYQCLTQWKAHQGKILASCIINRHGKQLFVTGANDSTVAVWTVENPKPSEQLSAPVEEDMMISSLRDFISYKTISAHADYKEDCRRGATFLRTLFRKLGGQVEMLSADDEDPPSHPVVFAKFSGKLEPAEQRKRILFYGHYDVVPADSTSGKWKSDPFTMFGESGYLYGRGVSDNKGPIMTALYAVTDLMQAKALDNDVIFLIEGQEESGSRGFIETVRQNKPRIGKVDYILLANSYWLNDEIPCLTYGLRGVLHATLCVQSRRPDIHSGVDGSIQNSEPLTDLTLLLAKVKNAQNKILIPGFYDGVLPLSEEEEAKYDEITAMLMEQGQQPKEATPESLKRNLMARWREPNLTIHRFMSSGGHESSIVSGHASAHISLRLVPGQEVDDVVKLLTDFLESEFGAFGSQNTLLIDINNKAEPWLGDTESTLYKTLEEGVVKVWEMDAEDRSDAGTKKKQKQRRPLYIREGGSIPAIRFLEKEFNAPAAQLPIGQASDSAHLDNERLRVLNLLKAREILAFVFSRL